MLQKLGGIAVFCATLAPLAVAAECTVPDFDSVAPSFAGAAPMPPAAEARPATPPCLRGLADPSQENCADGVVAAYAAQVEAYESALNTYLSQADSYARAAAEHANAAVVHAQAAQAQADAVFAYVTCEAEVLRAQE